MNSGADRNGKLERRLARALQAGAYVAGLLFLFGLGSIVVDTDIPPQAAPPVAIEMLWRNLRFGNPYAIVQVGVMLLLALPPLGVMISGLFFGRTGEKKDALASAAILVAILVSFLVARAA